MGKRNLYIFKELVCYDFCSRNYGIPLPHRRNRCSRVRRAQGRWRVKSTPFHRVSVEVISLIFLLLTDEKRERYLPGRRSLLGFRSILYHILPPIKYIKGGRNRAFEDGHTCMSSPILGDFRVG